MKVDLKHSWEREIDTNKGLKEKGQLELVHRGKSAWAFSSVVVTVEVSESVPPLCATTDRPDDHLYSA